MIRRRWSGSPTCYFCNEKENVQHHLFQCSTAKAVWAVVAHAIGAKNIPKSLNQCWNWCKLWLPADRLFHTLGIAAICWVIWKMRNSIYFEGKSVTSPATIVCYACSLMSYWAGLLMVANRDALVAGVNTMLAIAVKLMTKKKAKQGQLLLKDGQNDDQDR
jgi:hypothetical protein